MFLCNLLQIIYFSILFKSFVCDETSTTTLATTTEFQYNFSCPYDLTEFNYTCYTRTKEAKCPYYLPLPFDKYKDIASNLNSSTNTLDIIRNQKYDYFQWKEITGNYGKLFSENLTQTNTSDLFIEAQLNTTIMYYTANVSDYYFCAYNSFKTQPNTTYCSLWNKICSNNTNLDSTNCHCYINKTSKFFCETACDYFDYNDYNESICMECEEIFEHYKEPMISLSLNYIKFHIYVAVFSFLKLIPVEEEHNAIVYCFTDADHSKNDITYRYDVEIDFHVYNNSYKDLYYLIQPINGLIGHYWCEGFSYKNHNLDNVKSPLIIAQAGNIDESFTMNITIIENNRTFPLEIHENKRNEIWETIQKSSLNNIIHNVSFLVLYEKYNSDTKIGYRIYYNKTNAPNKTMIDILEDISNIFDNISVTPSYCLPEITNINGIILTWEKTLIGMTTIPEELCINNQSQPITRKCLGEYLYGTYWSNVVNTCVNNSGELFGSDSTIELHNITHFDFNASKKIDNLYKVLQTNKQPISIDAYFMAKIFQNITESNESINLERFIQIASDVMNLDRNVLKNAQRLLNSTDMILYNLDLILAKYKFNDDYGSETAWTVITDNIFVQVSKISENSTTAGAAVYESDSIIKLQKIPLHFNVSNMETKDLKLLIYLTPTQFQQFIKLQYPQARLIIVVFRFDSLFNHDTNLNTTGFLVGIHVSGFEEPFMYDSVRVLIKPDRRYRARLDCYNWDYGRDSLWYNQKGLWKYQMEAIPYKDLYSCSYWNMRHFSIIIGIEDDIVLSIIAAIGCALSIFGSLAVIVTSLIYKNWREKSGTKILLNFVLTNMLQNIILSFSSGIDSFKQPQLCKIVGASLHYFIISQFVWMLIIGYLQYLRYVQVFYTVNNIFVLLSSIAAWMLPIIPIIVIFALESDYYVQDNFCYLQNQPLFYGVFVPVSLSLTANSIIFGIILFNVCCKGKTFMSLNDNISWLNLRLVILLFFLLGMYWIFGIAARFTNIIAFDYFFCLTASLQGFIIFLYFIVFNKMTRNFWLKQLKLSEMSSAMQLWLQQKRRIGKIRLDKSYTKNIKIEIMRNLKSTDKERVKLA